MWEPTGSVRGLQAEQIGLDPAWLSATIGSIYDCALDPSGWSKVIGEIADKFSFASGLLGVAQVRPSAHELQVNYRLDDAWIRSAKDYTADMLALQGGAARIMAYPLDEPMVSSDLLPAGERKANRYYRDILEPRGMTDAILIALAREPELVGYLGLNRADATGPIRPREIQGLRLLAPHLRRAVTIGNLFDLKAVEVADLRSVLDSLPCAVVVVDAEVRIVHVNAAGETMLADGGLVAAMQGRLVVRGGLAGDALRGAVLAAADDEARMGQRGIGIPVTAKDGSVALLHVLPLARRDPWAALAQRAVAAVFIVSAGSGPHPPIDAIAALYDLTPAEGRVFASLCGGSSLAKTAEALGIARSTARTHLLHIFTKTGCGRQAELVALASRLSLHL